MCHFCNTGPVRGGASPRRAGGFARTGSVEGVQALLAGRHDIPRRRGEAGPRRSAAGAGLTPEAIWFWGAFSNAGSARPGRPAGREGPPRGTVARGACPRLHAPRMLRPIGGGTMTTTPVVSLALVLLAGASALAQPVPERQPADAIQGGARPRGEQRTTARSTQRLQAFAPVTTQRPVAADPECCQHAVDLVGERQPLLDQVLPLARGPATILLRLARDRHHRAHPGLAAQPGQGRAQQPLHVQRVGLCPPRPAVDGHARGLDHVHLDPAPEPPPR